MAKDHERRNPLKTGLVTASWVGLAVPYGGELGCRNPLKTGLVTARQGAAGRMGSDDQSVSQSPENGSRHCKSLRGAAGGRAPRPGVAIP